MKKYRPLSTNTLALLSLRHHPARTAGLCTVAALLAFVLFGGTLLAVSLRNGLSTVRERFGADLLVVPAEAGGEMEAILLKGEPNYFYLPRNVLAQVEAVPGVEKASGQFYLTSTGESCCSLPVQIIGFDPETDFSVQPWIQKVYRGTVSDGVLLAGSDITVDGGTLRFYGTDFSVAATLARTGSGFDRAVFANLETLRAVMRAAQEKGFRFIGETEPEESVSSVLVKVADGYDAAAVAKDIARTLDGVQVVRTGSIVHSLSDSLRGVSAFLYAFVALFVALALVVLAVVFAVTVHERKKECAVLRILGMEKAALSHLLLREALLVCAFSALCGIALSALVLLLFSGAVGNALGIPYVVPGIGIVLLVSLLSFALSSLAGPLAAMGAVLRESRADVYVTMREGE